METVGSRGVVAERGPSFEWCGSKVGGPCLEEFAVVRELIGFENLKLGFK